MAIILNDNDPAIVRGIKTVGVGKKGSQSLTPQLASEIAQDYKQGKIPHAAWGAFWGGLLNKGLTEDEQVFADSIGYGRLLASSETSDRSLQDIVCKVAHDASQDIQALCVRLLKQETLDQPTAYILGKFLFSNEPGDGARGLVASFLRVRYETPDEYAGLLQAMQETLEPAFQAPVPDGHPVIQLAEPFDGVDHSYMITPLIGKFIQSLGFRAIHLVGRNSGPKFVLNLFDIAGHMQWKLASGNADLGQPKPEFGWWFDQAAMSKSMDRWVALRHQTVKRPFLSTLEKFLNPVQARILITSAFHPPYGEKMLTVAERAGFPGAIVVRNGIEGTIAFPLLRSAKILCTARKKDNGYARHEFDFDPSKYLGTSVQAEEKLDRPSVLDNAALIAEFAQTGKTSNRLFDLRIKMTCQGLEQAIDWVERNIE